MPTTLTASPCFECASESNLAIPNVVWGVMIAAGIVAAVIVGVLGLVWQLLAWWSRRPPTPGDAQAVRMVMGITLGICVVVAGATIIQATMASLGFWWWPLIVAWLTAITTAGSAAGIHGIRAARTNSQPVTVSPETRS